MKQHVEDEGKKSLLRKLTICVESKGESVETYMFAFEALCALMPIPKVSVTGVPEWFATCVEMKIKGRGGDVAKVKVGGKKKARKWYQPVYEWRQFAARNGVEMPDGVDGFWAVE